MEYGELHFPCVELWMMSRFAGDSKCVASRPKPVQQCNGECYGHHDKFGTTHLRQKDGYERKSKHRKKQARRKAKLASLGKLSSQNWQSGNDCSIHKKP